MVIVFRRALTSLGVCLLFVSASGKTSGDTVAHQPIQHLQKQMQGKSRVSGQFRQERQIPSMNTKLSSMGDFEIRKPQEIRWHQTSPFGSTFVIAKDQATLQLAGGTKTPLDLKTQPAMLAVGQILSALFLGNSQSIDPYFEVVALPKKPSHPKTWSLKLLPREEMMKKVLDPILVSGNQFIESIEIRNKSGNLTKISFTNVKAQ